MKNTGVLDALAGLLLAALIVASPSAVAGDNPRNLDECLQMLRAPLEQQCHKLFAGQEAQRDTCLQQTGPQIAAVCEQFFGEGRDFCATCTASCTGNYTAGDTRRRECLSMCLQQPGCS